MKIKVILAGRSIFLECEPSDLIEKVTAHIQSEEGIIDEFKLRSQGRELDSSLTF